MTFVLLSREASSETPNVEKNPPNSVIPRFVDIEEDATSSGRTENVQRDESPMIVRRSRSDAFISNVLLDPYSRSTAYFDEQWPQLRAGSFVRLQGTESAPRESWRSFGTQPSDPPGTQDSGNTTQDRQKRSAPSPPMTRERLLKELLGVSASSLL